MVFFFALAASTATDPSLFFIDNASGFPLRGRSTYDDLARRSFAPRSIIERVSNLGGTVKLSSQSDGAELIIRIPNQSIEL